MKIKVGKKVILMGRDFYCQPLQRDGKVVKILNKDLVEVKSRDGEKFMVFSRNLKIVGQ